MSYQLFRPYKNNSPVTTKWYRTYEEAMEWGETFAKDGFEIKTKDINELLINRKKTGFRGLI